MTDYDNIVLEHLRAIRSKVDKIDRELTGVHHEMTGLRQHMAGFLTHESYQDGEIASIKERLEKIETRLSLSD